MKASAAILFASLRVRFLILILLVMAPLVALLLFAASEARRAAHAEAQANLLRIVRIISSDQERIIERTRQLLIVLAQLSAVRNGDGKACSELFARIDREHPIYASLGGIEADGSVFCNSLPMATRIYAGDHDYFTRAMITRDFSAGEYRVNRQTGLPSIYFGYPVIDDRGRARSVVFAALDLGWLNRLAYGARLPEGAMVQMIDRKGNVLVHYPDPGNAEGKSFSEAQFISAIPADKVEGNVEAVGADGILRLYAFRSFTGFGAGEVYIVIRIAKNALFAKADENLKRHMVTIGLFSLLALAMACFGIDRVVLQKTDKLMEATQRIAGGDLNARTGLEHGRGEFGLLANSFDMMASALQARETQNQSAQNEIRQLNEALEQRVLERTAQLEAANHELESFSYSVSHDLRAPLRSIYGFSQALLEDFDDKLDAQGKDYLRRVCAASQHMSMLIDDLLQLSRVTRSELREEVVDLSALAKTIAAELQASRDDRSGEFRIAEGMVSHGDQRLLRVALENLLGNAWKFTAKVPRPTIEFGVSAQNGKQSYFVRDNGAGFDMAYADKLFRPFQRLHDARDFDGTGVGLATVQRIIRRHGGEIWTQASEGHGATFYFTLARIAGEMYEQ